LQRYDVVVLDEVHERHISTDLLLALVRRLLLIRPTLKLGSFVRCCLSWG
jgi:HrpA-like RNA helicase